jgi:O-antigen/teichoic acid export membrane protein
MRRRLTSGAPALAVTFLAIELCGLLRIAIFAHVLAPASMGVVIIMGTWLRFVEMVTDVSLDRYLLRAPDGASRLVQNSAHGAAILRGLAGTAFMLVSLLPLLAVYGLWEEVPAFLAVSFVPLVRGFAHLDYRLHNRLMRFRSTITVELASALLGLVAAFSVFAVPGLEAFAAVLVAQAVTAVLLSHLCARRAYRIAFQGDIQRKLWQAGWPLAANALLLYAVFQGERLFIGGILGLEVLGSYAIAAQLALLPVLMAGRLSTSLALPILARADATTPRGIQTREDVIQFFLTAGLLFWLGFVALATPVIQTIFGAEYVQSVADISWIAAATALRLQKTGAVTLLLASSRSRDILSGNSARLSGLAAGVIGMVLTRDLTVFLAAAAAGEAISYAMAAYRASPRALSVMLPVPVLVMAAVHAHWPDANEIMFPLAGVMLSGSAFILIRMAARHLRGSRATLQQASS